MLALMAPAAAWSQGSPNPKLVEAAKKEGEAVYYTTMTLDQSKSVVDRFEKKYGIKVILFRTGGGPLLNRFSPNRAAGGMIGTWSSAAARWCCR
jgi:iron(III) transport system substrate-binding protein